MELVWMIFVGPFVTVKNQNERCLGGLARPDLFPRNVETIDTAKKVTKYIYNHAYVLNWMKRDSTNGRQLVRPAITRFATSFISLQNLIKFCKVKNRVTYTVRSEAEAWLAIASMDGKAQSNPDSMKVFDGE